MMAEVLNTKALVCVSGDLRSESDAPAAGESPRRGSAGAVHHRAPDQALQLWRPQLHHLQPRHLTGTELPSPSGSRESQCMKSSRTLYFSLYSYENIFRFDSYEQIVSDFFLFRGNFKNLT